MHAWWVGIRGELTSEQVATLHRAGLAPGMQLRESVGRYGSAEWHTLRTFVRAEGADEQAAIERVAEVLDVRSDDLIAYDAGIFK